MTSDATATLTLQLPPSKYKPEPVILAVPSSLPALALVLPLPPSILTDDGTLRDEDLLDDKETLLLY